MTNHEKSKILDNLFKAVKLCTKTRTSIPKEVKFLKPLYPKLVEYFKKSTDSQFNKELSDFLSYICITLSDDYKIDSFNFL